MSRVRGTRANIAASYAVCSMCEFVGREISITTETGEDDKKKEEKNTHLESSSLCAMWRS